ncbi:MAG: hypothetical protein RMI79_07175 [Nitrososphaerota archaeon]|nr:hypothetical protein [Nitrososphaerota archaeon]
MSCTKDELIIIIFDTSVIIELIRKNLVEDLARYKESVKAELILPSEVLDELRKGSMNCNSISPRFFKVVSIDREIAKELRLRYLGLGDGEVGVLSTGLFFKKHSASEIIILVVDDSYARKVAKRLGFIVHGTLWLLLQLKKHKITSKEKIMQIVKELPDSGF